MWLPDTSGQWAHIHMINSTTSYMITRPLGVTRIVGRTRLDLIDRMSTQRVKNLRHGQGAATILTTDIGRMIDRLLVYAGEESALALTGEENAPRIVDYMMRYVFFNDEFVMTDETAATAVLALYGTGTAAILHHMGALAAAELPLHHWQPSHIAGVPLTLHRTDPLAGEGYFLLVPPAHLPTVQAALAQAGVQQMEEGEFEALRVAAGWPRYGREITADYIPLEANLWADVSFNKGCYIGQEIIARMESRGQIAKRLVRLQAAVPLTQGMELTAAGRTVGSITTAAGEQALGYVKTAALRDTIPLFAAEIPLTVLRDENTPEETA